MSTDAFLSIKNYFFLGTRGFTHNITTYGTCSRLCWTTNIYNAKDGLLTIDAEVANDISACLQTCDVVLEYDSSVNIAGSITWSTDHNLSIKSSQNITVASAVKLSNNGHGTLRLIAGFDSSNHLAAVTFESDAKIYNSAGGMTYIYCNPARGNELHKYHNHNVYNTHISPMTSLRIYSWINSLEDLQDVRYFLSGNYALSKDIHCSDKDSFVPLGNDTRPFSGKFDGNNHGIIGLHIQGDEQVGIFGLISGTKVGHAMIHDLWLKDIKITGNHYVGLLSGEAEYVDFKNIAFVSGNTISAHSIAGGLVGSASGIKAYNINLGVDTSIQAQEYSGLVAGAIRYSDVSNISEGHCEISSMNEDFNQCRQLIGGTKYYGYNHGPESGE